MSNFVCPTCGLSSIDCGKNGYKTPLEIKIEQDIIKCEAIIGGLVNEGNDYKQKYQCSLAKGKLSAEKTKN